MPSFIKTQKDEEIWSRAKAQVRKQYPDITESSKNFWALTNSIYQKMTHKKSLKKNAGAEEHPKYYRINPKYKDRDRVSGFSHSNAMRWGLGTGLLSGIGGALATHKADPKDQAIAGIGLGGIGFGLGYLGRSIYDVIRGTPYDVENYDISGVKPEDTVVVGMSGASGGPGGPVDKILNKLYGKGNVAMFNWRNRDKLVEFLKKLPKDTKVIAHGHSYGGSALTNAIAESGKLVDRLYTYDPVSWSERFDKKPKNVKKWLNILPTDTSASVGYNWVAHLGGRWDRQLGADDNLYVEKKGLGHSAISELIRRGTYA